MEIKTGIRAGMTPQEFAQNFQNSATAVVDTVGDAADVLSASSQDAVQGVQDWLGTNDVGGALNRAFWFPFDPPQ